MASPNDTTPPLTSPASQTTVPVPPPANPIIIHQDSSSFPVSIILDETNYPIWSQLLELRIGARNKSGYLTGTKPKPPPHDPSFETWVTENQKVKSWLIDSMSPSLMPRFLRLEAASEIWDACRRTYFDGSDETILFELNQKSFTLKQNGRPLASYYNDLSAIFQEIDHRTTSDASTVAGVVHLHSAMVRLRVHIFLSGLDSEFHHLRGEILRKEPKLDLEGSYASVSSDSLCFNLSV